MPYEITGFADIAVGNVLIRKGAHAPFVVCELSTSTSEIVCRAIINQWGGTTVRSNRAIRARSLLSQYLFISNKFMDSDYVKWAKVERAGLFLKKEPEPPKKPTNNQLEAVKAVFFRQNRYLNPGIPVAEVERLWNEQYFPLYSQVCYELDLQIETTGKLSPLNYDPPDPSVKAPESYLKTLHCARAYQPEPEKKVEEKVENPFA